MNRLLTSLSVAICIAGSASISLAGPSVDSAPFDVPALRGSSGHSPDGVVDFPSSAGLLGSLRPGGFAHAELQIGNPGRQSRGLPQGSFGVPTARFILDVNDFMLPRWQAFDADVRVFSDPITTGEPLPYAQFALVTSTDVNTLSVPQIPLPLAAIPGLIGVGWIAIYHLRLTRNGKISK